MDFKALYQSGKKAIISTLDEDVPMDVRLEQAEFSNDSGYWEVVVSFLIENKNLSPLKYRSFTIRNCLYTGENQRK